ncbi:MAG TPA: FAD-dependent oxidoreductase, partial [Candidatus Acidoferrales bacterium]|nr:FAD-dependent oxidoreductase [Candidatus Acidoferrales bacterium]
DTDQLKRARNLPREAVIVGGGVIGLEYASILAALDIRITLIEQRPTLLDFVDKQIIDALCDHLSEAGMTFRLGEKVAKVGFDSERSRVFTELESGKTVYGDALLYAVGRQANTDLLSLEAVGLKADERGRLRVNQNFQTEVPHIYAAGDVIGFPALASTSMEQGRLASCHMFGQPCQHVPELIPYGIYTIPEVSMVGRTEAQLIAANIPYAVGIAKYEDVARAQMMGDQHGMLKLLFDPKTRKLLGVHAIGDLATEYIHIGQAVLTLGGTIDYFRDSVFNYPTLAEAYKIAALEGFNRLNV